MCSLPTLRCMFSIEKSEAPPNNKLSRWRIIARVDNSLCQLRAILKPFVETRRGNEPLRLWILMEESLLWVECEPSVHASVLGLCGSNPQRCN